MYNKFAFFLFFIFLGLAEALGQQCTFKIKGEVIDASSNEPIEFVNIYIKESASGTISDSKGNFLVDQLCAGSYHLIISHVGCETQEVFIPLSGDTVIRMILDHNSHLLHEMAVTAKRKDETTQEVQKLNENQIVLAANQNLANMLEGVSGVSAIKTGNNVSKPVVHGLNGNRVAIVNNGIVQSGQQWGADHSPEIDPLIANNITVVKGVGAVEYQGSSLGSVILVEPKKIENDPHIHGSGGYFFQSNGRGNGVNLQIQQYTNVLAWRMVGTLKKAGDNRTSSYFLRNTGMEEANLALQLEKSVTDKLHINMYFSTFNSNNGILRGSQVGSITDMEEALTRDVPFYTEEEFSNEIGPPSQHVNHHLVKLHSSYQIDSSKVVDVTYAGQLDLRKEYDVRRGGRSEDPSLSLEQFSHFLEGKYMHNFSHRWKLKTGIQFTRKDNSNVPETGVLPLIPDYISSNTGIFGMVSKNYDKLMVEVGGRYDYTLQNVAAISITVPREIIRYENVFHNYNASTGFIYSWTKNWKIGYNIGLASRNPEVNELYSNGLHQGVSGIEEGDPNLQTEYAVKNTLSIKGEIAHKLFLEGLFYTQNIRNYIYLDPQDELRLTIRGAFPVFKYVQTDARISGFDLSGIYQFTDAWKFNLQYSYLYGWDVEGNLPLVYMPSNNLMASVAFQLPRWGTWENFEFSLMNRLVFEQKNLLPSQDFVPPPDTYNLIGFKASTQKQVAKVRFQFYIEINNLLNVSFRDYLNRQRYFADDLGINVIVGVRVNL